LARTLLDALPMWVLGLCFVLLPAAAAAGAVLLIRSRWPRAREGAYKDTGATLLTQTLSVYGLVLAFVIVNQYSAFDQTRKDVQTEALNVEDAYRSAQSFDPAGRSAVSTAIGSYVRSVVDDEWPALSDGKASPSTAAAFRDLNVALRTNAPRDPAALVHYGNAIGYLHTAHDARHRRLDAAGDSLPGTLAAFLLLGALACVSATLLLGMRSHRWPWPGCSASPSCSP
jgi:hypothetical protein